MKLYSEKEIQQIVKAQNDIYWWSISEDQKLSEGFIREFQTKVDWWGISRYQILSEEFIEKFQDKVCWYWISRNQELSEKFIEKFQDLVNWNLVLRYQKLPKNFIKKHDLRIPENNWINKTSKEKLDFINKNYPSFYEIRNNKIMAYKGVQSNWCSAFDSKYKYEIGKVFESHCDCDLDEENSFGLSAGAFEKAKEYCNEKILRVEIDLKDLGAIVHDGGKLRCFKLKVLEEVC